MAKFTQIRAIGKSLDCPICATSMQCLDFYLGQRSIQVDRYKECQSFLFDPVELQLTGEASEERDKPRVTREFNLKDHPVLESAYLEFEKLKLNRLIFLARFAATLLIAFDAWMYSQTCKFDQDYPEFSLTALLAQEALP